ncbi:hypothetical protein EDB86DRAFT_3083190 [Lactarius hatsudake]|nr:hypothetical protein EDB86DRAFT_3083190 [Lactarius hatsudake]
MTHILNLGEQDRQSIINNLLLMGMGGSVLGDVATPQINAIGLDFAPFAATSPPTPALELDAAPVSANPAPIPPPFSPHLTLVDDPLPCPPCSPHCPHSPRIAPPPLPVVEDDKAPKGGVKTSPSLSVFDSAVPINKSLCQAMPAIPHPLREYRPIFCANVFERPRDPDEVRPQAPQPPMPRPIDGRDRTSAADIIPPPPQPTNPGTTPVVARNSNRHAGNIHSRRQNQNDTIYAWLQQVIHNPPSRAQPRPCWSLLTIVKERIDPEQHEYRYDYDYADARHED